MGVFSAGFDSIILKDAITGHCHFLDVSFQHLLETLDMVCVSLQAKKGFFLVEPSYGNRRPAGKPEAVFGVFKNTDICNILDLAMHILRPGKLKFLFVLPSNFWTRSAHRNNELKW